MGKAICNNCGARAEGNTEQEAITKLNHAVGRSRNIRCGVNSDNIVTTGFTTKVEPPKPTQTQSKPTESTKPSSTTSKKTETSSKETKKQTKSSL